MNTLICSKINSIVVIKTRRKRNFLLAETVRYNVQMRNFMDLVTNHKNIN